MGNTKVERPKNWLLVKNFDPVIGAHIRAMLTGNTKVERPKNWLLVKIFDPMELIFKQCCLVMRYLFSPSFMRIEQEQWIFYLW